jgi:hypothetical protein
MKQFTTITAIIFYCCLSFHISAQDSFEEADMNLLNIEVDSLSANFSMDKNRAKLIALDKPNDRSDVVDFFNTLKPHQKADVMKNRMQQALTVPSLSMTQKRVIVWAMKKVNPDLYDANSPKREEEAKKTTTELMPLLSKHFTKEQACLLFAECSMKGIEY